MMEKLSKIERKILPNIKNWISIKELSENYKINESEIHRAIMLLKNKNLIEEKVEEFEEIVLTERGKECLENGFPEEIIFREVKKVGKENIKNLFEKFGNTFNIALKILKDLDIVEIVGNEIVVKKDFDFSNYLLRKKEMNEEEINICLKRGLIKKERRKKIFIKLNENGLKILNELKEEDLIENLTHEIIITKSFVGKKFREYDVLSKVPKIDFGKRSRLREVEKIIREIWISMGFEEMEGSLVTTSFFNFDLMFFSQDHPDRELMGTYYIIPEKGEIDEELAKKIKSIYKNRKKENVDIEKFKDLILRTHTTAISFQYLYRNIYNKIKVGEKLKIPGKYFCIGKVFRVDVFDYKHLPEFHQIEGFVIDKNLSFKDLLSYLSEFYKKMGITKIKFKPVYNPYTEPSAEIFAWIENKKSWMEVGNSGIFRRECLDPLKIKENVIAWGLALERLVMIIYDINDIREVHGYLSKIW